MEMSISNLKTEFNEIGLVRTKILGIFETLKSKMDRLKNLYSDYVKQSNTPLFVFGLDSFHFQNKLIDLEYDDMKSIKYYIKCESYKYVYSNSFIENQIKDTLNENTKVITKINEKNKISQSIYTIISKEIISKLRLFVLMNI
jgi:hypothetical protein